MSLKFEKKFIILSFLTFFILQIIFISVINYYNYKEYKYFIKDNIRKKIEICSYKLNCKDVEIDFINKQTNLKIFDLLENKQNFYMLFAPQYLKNYYMKLTLNKTIYNKKIEKIKLQIFKQMFIETIIIIFLSLLFTFFLFIPLKEAYKINETFIKDILHDFNTPLSTLKLNLYLLQKEIGDNERIKKINQNIKSIINYQQNLKTFLQNNPNQKETFNIKTIIDDKLKFYSQNYPTISYQNTANMTIKINKSSFDSIIENLISNAFKYNKKNGTIIIYIKNNKLYIKDTGIGIKNPHKIFDRFYKENERGIGIGMHIVKKLSDELKLDIKIISDKTGSIIILDLKRFNISLTKH